MIHLMQWAIRNNVSRQALYELEQIMGTVDTTSADTSHPPRSEAAVSADYRKNAAARGDRVFRNNVGAGKLESGSFVRWGLANDSEAMNKVIKSSDFIGIHRFVVQPEHVGHTFGQFDAAEFKGEDWTYTGTDRERAQLAFLNLVVALGGRGRFINRMGAV